MVELKVGDVVTVKVAKENREWGYNPCPDRSKGVVKSFGEISLGELIIMEENLEYMRIDTGVMCN